jgi:PAS domain S-box-containing protein
MTEILSIPPLDPTRLAGPEPAQPGQSLDESLSTVQPDLFITERMSADQIVLRNQTLLRMAGRLSRMGAWSVEVPSFAQTWSSEVCAIHEVPPGFTVTVEEAIDYYAPELRETITQAFLACVRDGTPFDLELQILTAAGRRVWVRSIGEAVRGADGAITSVQGALQDISERKAAEAETRNLADRLTATLESLTDGFFTLDREWRFTYVNREAERMFTLSRADLLGHHIWDKFPEARGTISHQEYERAVRDNVAVQFDTFYPPLGIWFDARAFPSAQGLAVYFRDITDARGAAEALRGSEERCRLLVNATTDAIWDWDLGTNALWWNAGYEKLFGYRREDIDPTVRSWTECIHPDDLARVSAGIHHVIEHDADGWTDEYRFRCHDGSYAYVLDRGHVIRDAGGKALRMIGGMTDLTDRKRAAEALHAEIVERKRAESAADAANRSKSEFLANMSHEIRTPLNGVIGMTELALGTDLNAEQRDYLTMVKSSGESLLNVINDILDFSKVEAGKLTVDLIPFELNHCLAGPIKLLATRAHAKGLELACDIRPDVPTALVGDPNRLRQIVTNLIGNAIKFTERGEVVLTVEVETQSDRAAVLRFSISDTGIGVPSDRQEAVFKPFVQADGSTTRKYGGTGLGLAISTSLAALLGGRMWLESEAGKGSTFLFTVPYDLDRAPALAPVTDKRTAQIGQLRDMPVLVVDDNAVNRRILEATLRRWHLNPVLAESGPAGVAAAQAHKLAGTPFRLVLLDSQMPGMDGFATAAAIRSDPSLAGTLLLMLTSGGLQGDAARCRVAGIAGYLMKPVSQAELLEAILVVVGGQAGAPDPVHLLTRHTLRENLRKLRILLAEDNPVNQMVAARLLEKRGHTVVIVGDGSAALAALDEPDGGGFDLILMDVQMPEMDGLEATARIRVREKSSGRHLPIVAMTAHAMKGDEERCLAGGMDGYVSKPIQVEQLFATIARVME